MTDNTYENAAHVATRAIETARNLEEAMRIFKEREKAYNDVRPIIDAYKAALQNTNFWRSEFEEARDALHKAVRDEARAVGRNK